MEFYSVKIFLTSTALTGQWAVGRTGGKIHNSSSDTALSPRVIKSFRKDGLSQRGSFLDAIVA